MPGWQDLSLGLGACRITVPDTWRLERTDDHAGRLLLPSGRSIDTIAAFQPLPATVGPRELLEYLPESKAVPGFGWQHIGAGAFRVTVRQTGGAPRLIYVTTSRVAERHLRIVRFLPDSRARETEAELVRIWSNFGDMVRNAWFADAVTLPDLIAADGPNSPWQRMIMGGRLHLRVPRDWQMASPEPFLWVFWPPSGAELRVRLADSPLAPGETPEQALADAIEEALNDQPGEVTGPPRHDRAGAWLGFRDGVVERLVRLVVEAGRLTRASFELPAQPGEAMPAQLRQEILLAVIEDALYALAKPSAVRPPPQP